MPCFPNGHPVPNVPEGFMVGSDGCLTARVEDSNPLMDDGSADYMEVVQGAGYISPHDGSGVDFQPLPGEDVGE